MRVSELIMDNSYIFDFSMSGNRVDNQDYVKQIKKTKTTKEKEITINDEEQLCKNMATFIKYNINLIHLDLS